jgi:hypothetical protein
MRASALNAVIILCAVYQVANAGPRSSANYNILTDALDYGGVTASSANYQNTGSAGLISGIASTASGSGVNKSGYVGQLAFSGLVPSSVSRKMHGATVFDIALPLTGAAGVECRTGGVNSNHQVIVTFPSAVSLTNASVTTGTGTVSSFTVSGGQVTVNLTGVSNAQTIAITLFGVSDGTNMADVTIPMGVLLGDTSGNGSVNATDVSLTKSKSGQAVNASNFRTDVTLSNSINSSDVSTVKSKSGTALP